MIGALNNKGSDFFDVCGIIYKTKNPSHESTNMLF
jgi:hypothetical protein